MSENKAISQINALQADRVAVIELARGLKPAEWESPSGCAGWTTKDLVSHLAATFWAVVDGSAGPDTSGLEVEEASALTVEARRSMTPAEVLADYESVSLRALELLPTVAALDLQIPLSPTESYPASLVPAMFVFDHYTHIRADLFAPRGSLTSEPPPTDELRLAPTLDWIEAALPQQNPALIPALPGRVDLVVTGLCARTIPVGRGDLVATVTSDGPSLVYWITQRARQEDLGVDAQGDPAALAAASQLKVY